MPRTPNTALGLAREAMSPLLTDWMTKPEVQALYILSSSADCPDNPTCFDEESDFDVAVVLDIPLQASEWRPHFPDTCQLIADRIPNWVPKFLFHVPMPWGSMEVNVHQLIYQYECDPRTAWPGEKCDTYLHKSQVLHDRGGSFQELIHHKAQAARTQLGLERERLANRITWDVREMSLRQSRRLGPEAGHYLLNLAVDEVIDCIYATAGQFIPNRKWKLSQLVSRGFITEEQAGILRDAIRCDPTCRSDLERRVEALEMFCATIDGFVTDGPEAQQIRSRYQHRLQLRGSRCADPDGAAW
ncbi:hypothetical protein LN042_33555 [Kitasatospora sp. RB6PN24]|uniref:hypothetical protein n=1 Tax=Kitasatospora humi TaxID=2893891 RepID=UPI001E4745C1|nr:hypothetical protein [Kitasatospora humi]MCC9311933.1 hypothetical protein [Kitasatospora humi]